MSHYMGFLFVLCFPFYFKGHIFSFSNMIFPKISSICFSLICCLLVLIVGYVLIKIFSFAKLKANHTTFCFHWIASDISQDFRWIEQYQIRIQPDKHVQVVDAFGMAPFIAGRHKPQKCWQKWHLLSSPSYAAVKVWAL